MSTPTKRRKPNSYKSSPQSVGSLDLFFNKKKNEDSINARHTKTGPPATHSPEHQSSRKGRGLTDEELARRLQSEWDEEVKAREQDPAVSCRNPSLESESYYRARDANNTTNGFFEPRENSSNRQETPKDEVPLIEQDQAMAKSKKDTLALQSTASAEDAVSCNVPFDENPLTFDPSKYLPELKGHWANQGGDASYGLLTRCFVLVNSTQSRIKIVDTVVNFLRAMIEGDSESLLPAVGYIYAMQTVC